jgi:hypothetical protein
MAMNLHTTTEELLEVVFSVVHTEAVPMRWRGKYVSVETNPNTTIEELCFLWICADGL